MLHKDCYGFWSSDADHICDICKFPCKTLLKNPSCNKFKPKGDEDGREGKETKA